MRIGGCTDFEQVFDRIVEQTCINPIGICLNTHQAKSNLVKAHLIHEPSIGKGIKERGQWRVRAISQPSADHLFEQAYEEALLYHNQTPMAKPLHRPTLKSIKRQGTRAFVMAGKNKGVREAERERGRDIISQQHTTNIRVLPCLLV